MLGVFPQPVNTFHPKRREAIAYQSSKVPKNTNGRQTKIQIVENQDFIIYGSGQVYGIYFSYGIVLLSQVKTNHIQGILLMKMFLNYLFPFLSYIVVTLGFASYLYPLWESLMEFVLVMVLFYCLRSKQTKYRGFY